MNIENIVGVFEYLRYTQFTPEMPIGTDIVALLGTTKHANQSNNTYNCFSISELSEAVIPYYVPIKSDSIISGAIAITPKTVNKRNLLSRF